MSPILKVISIENRTLRNFEVSIKSATHIIEFSMFSQL